MPDVILNPAQREKLRVIRGASEGELTNDQAGKLLKLSIRQIQRLKERVRRDGEKALIHGLKNRTGNHKISLEQRDLILGLIREKYADFKPSFAAEKLADNHGILVNPETLRLWLIEEKLWKTKKQKSVKYHAWRERKEYFGELQQFDGSYHLWFESRLLDEIGNPQEVCLLASIDDATSQITHALFDFSEGVIPVFNFWKEYLINLGKPSGIYLDRYSTYKINHKNAVDNSELLTQFEKAMKILNIRVITANSPQAKGRIERLFRTLQDRLVKELRLNNINTTDQANIFLRQVFIPKFNVKFSVRALKDGNIHSPTTRLEKQSLNSIFSIKEIRSVNNDYTIQFKNNFYQLEQIQPLTIRPKEKIITEEWLDNSLKFSFKGKYLKYFLLPQKPKKQKNQTAQAILTTHKPNWKPPRNHPWKRPWRG